MSGRGPPGSEWSAAWQAFRSSYPSVDLEQAAVLQRLRRGWGTLSFADITASATPDLLLAVAAELREPHALELFTELVRLAARAASGAGRAPPPAADIQQEMLRELFSERPAEGGKLQTFRGSGSLGSWLKTYAVRLALKMDRKAKPVEANSEEIDAGVAASPLSPELALFKARHREQFAAIFREALATLEPRQRNMLRLRYLDQLTVQEIGGVYQLHHSNVVRALKKTESQLSLEVKRRLAQQLKLEGERVESAVDALLSGLHGEVWQGLK